MIRLQNSFTSFQTLNEFLSTSVLAFKLGWIWSVKKIPSVTNLVNFVSWPLIGQLKLHFWGLILDRTLLSYLESLSKSTFPYNVYQLIQLHYSSWIVLDDISILTCSLTTIMISRSCLGFLLKVKVYTHALRSPLPMITVDYVLSRDQAKINR